MVPKHWSAWVWKSFANISLAIKEFLRIENGNLYTNYQMNKSIKNQIYPKINHNTSPWADCTIRQSGCHQNSYCCYHTTWETNRYANQLTSPGFQQRSAVLGIDVFKGSNQTYWKMEVEIYVLIYAKCAFIFWIRPS